GEMTWDYAMSYASGLSLGGHSGWRLPTKDELFRLDDSPCKSMMEVVSSYYWSSTARAGYASYAWRVNFGYGYPRYFHKSGSYYVRLVRGAQ
ncbi:MAG: DUF1566 domain-containing protein, partial [Desulfonatronovibrio sp.]